MQQIAKIYIWIFLLSPFLSYWVVNDYFLIPYYFFGTIGTVVAFAFIVTNRTRILNLLIPLFLLLLYYLFWSFNNDRMETIGIIKYIFKDRALHSISFIIIASNINLTSKDISNYTRLFKVYIILSVIFSLLQTLYLPGFFIPVQFQYFDENTAAYVVRNPSMWAYLDLFDVGLTFVPLLAFVVHKSIIKKKWMITILWLLAGALVCMLNNSRWVILNYCIVLVYCGYLIYKVRKQNLMSSIFSYSIIIIFVSVFALTFINSYIYKISDFTENRLSSNSAESRVLGYELFLKYFPKNPWFGTGIHIGEDLAQDLVGKSSQIHVGYLSHLYEYGIVGSLFLFSFWAAIFIHFKRIGNKTGNYVYIVMFMCFLLANVTLVEYSVYHIGILLPFILTSGSTNRVNGRESYRTKNSFGNLLDQKVV